MSDTSAKPFRNKKLKGAKITLRLAGPVHEENGKIRQINRPISIDIRCGVICFPIIEQDRKIGEIDSVVFVDIGAGSEIGIRILAEADVHDRAQ